MKAKHKSKDGTISLFALFSSNYISSMTYLIHVVTSSTSVKIHIKENFRHERGLTFQDGYMTVNIDSGDYIQVEKSFL